ncbi:MAG: succinate dehydrogenase [Planctomycetota bacterium]|jgi:hypothetical protein|nr:succinate dehydrogenase [Planctomycetota bacterium]
MSPSTLTGGHKAGLAQTLRADSWWTGPALTATILLGFITYSTWAAFQANHYWVDGGAEGFGGYLSPFYSPVLLVDTQAEGSVPAHHSWFGEKPDWWPSSLPFSPAFLILAFPGAFRFTCYYYRKAYYRTFTGTPPGCSVGAVPQKKYKGETSFLIFQNLHRYALYFAIAFIFILSWDAFQSYFRGGKIGIGVGSVVLTLNVVFLSCYTFGCHSYRHLIGGKMNRFSGCAIVQTRHRAWQGCSWLNTRHMLFAWVSLFGVALTDVYVRLVSMNVIKDFNTWN